MNIEELMTRAAIEALTQPTVEYIQQQTYDSNGIPFYVTQTVPGKSLLHELVVPNLKHEERVRLAEVVFKHIAADPELLAPIIAEEFKKWMTKNYDRYGSDQESLFFKDTQKVFNETARAVAEKVLEEDASFRERVLDMARLSDGDHIDISINMKPAGQ